MHSPRVSFYLTFCLQPSKKCVGEIFDPYLRFFTKNTPHKSNFSVSMNRTVWKSSLNERLRPRFFNTELWPSGKSIFFYFWPFFKLFVYSRKLPCHICDFFGSIQEPVLGSSLAYATIRKFFWHQKWWPSEKNKIWVFDRFFYKLLTYLENYPPKSEILG